MKYNFILVNKVYFDINVLFFEPKFSLDVYNTFMYDVYNCD